jgi:hypothetical protein
MLPIAFVGSFMTVNITATVRQDVRAIVFSISGP